MKSAREAAATAKDRASAANAVLYELNNEAKNVTAVLGEKTGVIGGAKDLAVDLQKRANEVANSATNKLSSIYGEILAADALLIAFRLSKIKCFVMSTEYCFPIYLINFLSNYASLQRLRRSTRRLSAA